MFKPTIGREAYYVNGRDILPAIITKVWSENCVNLHVMNNGLDDTRGVCFNVCNIEFDSSLKNNTWSWIWPSKT